MQSRENPTTRRELPISFRRRSHTPQPDVLDFVLCLGLLLLAGLIVAWPT